MVYVDNFQYILDTYSMSFARPIVKKPTDENVKYSTNESEQLNDKKRKVFRIKAPKYSYQILSLIIGFIDPYSGQWLCGYFNFCECYYIMDYIFL